MAVRPIIFSDPMVRALLEGRKTQTRRVVKPQPPDHLDLLCGPDQNGRYHWTNGMQWEFWPGGLDHPEYDYRPPWRFGDLLWVRQAWAPVVSTGASLKIADSPRDDPRKHAIRFRADGDKHVYGRWKSAIHMPRWASRLTLEVTDVWVQRLQDISEAEAQAEGIGEYDGALDEVALCRRAKLINGSPEDARTWFAVIWDSLNAKRGYGWDQNPWVVALIFVVHRSHVDDLLKEREAA